MAELEKIFQASAYKLVAQDNPKDRIEVVLGDDKEPDILLPQAKIQRWDNEASVSIRFSGLDNYSAYEDKGKIILGDEEKEVHLYEIAPNNELKEGGFEIEVVLNKKPRSNVLEFTLVDKDVEYFYQPPLTQEEIDQGAVRPENVVGSYAVYAKTPKTNWKGGKLYRVGKVGHIYRPRIVDSAGAEVWGELHIENGILSVTIPQEFLDKADYPIRVDPTFGYTEAGLTSQYLGQNYLAGSLFTSPSDAATATSITARASASGPPYSSAKGVLVLHSDLTIISNGVTEAGTNIFPDNPSSWQTVSFPTPPTLSGDTGYVLSLATNYLSLRYDSGDTNQGHIDSTNSYASPINPTDAVHDNNKYSIYCTYEAGGTETNSERATKLIGNATANSQRAAILEGQKAPVLSASQVDNKIKLIWTY